MPLSRRFFRNHLVLPLLLTLLFSGLLMGLGGDLWLADQLYAWQGHHWAVRDAWLTRVVLHQGGRTLSAALLVVVLAVCAWSWTLGRHHPFGKRWRWPLLYLVLAGMLGAGIVSILKSVTNMDCPWSLARYGGSQDYVGLFETRPAGMPRGVCFPGGHASAG